MIKKKFFARTLALPLAFAVAFSGGNAALADTYQGHVPTPTTQVSGTSTDYIVTPDGTATVTEDLENQTITVIDETGQKAVFDRAEILDMAAQISTSKQDSRMARTASVSEGTRAYLCNLFAGTAAASQSWAWQTALAIAKVHPGVRLVVSGGQIAFWAFITTKC